jgi:hypothetical protein
MGSTQDSCLPCDLQAGQIWMTDDQEVTCQIVEIIKRYKRDDSIDCETKYSCDHRTTTNTFYRYGGVWSRDKGHTGLDNYPLIHLVWSPT